MLRGSRVSQPGTLLDLAGKGKEGAKYRHDTGYLGLRKGTQGQQAGGGASFSAEGPTARTPSRKGSQIHKGSHGKTWQARKSWSSKNFPASSLYSSPTPPLVNLSLLCPWVSSLGGMGSLGEGQENQKWGSGRSPPATPITSPTASCWLHRSLRRQQDKQPQEHLLCVSSDGLIPKLGLSEVLNRV